VAIEVVAHRGSNEEEPEHSLAAYLRAVDEGADAVECDVRLTADGTLVLVHDRRINRTSSGRGAVSAMTFGQLSAHDYSGGPTVWRDFEDPTPDESRTSVLTLDRMLVTLMERSSTIKFSIETKHPTRFGRYVERELVDVLRRHGLAVGSPRVRIMSFSSYAVKWVAEHEPQYSTVFLLDRIPRRYRDGSVPPGVTGVGVSIELLYSDPEYIARVKARGNFVHVWTVDTVTDVDLCVALGVDGIISNRPGFVIDRLREQGLRE
jgi:glycerophosphoryl diester phosphodiesterase